MMLTASLWTMRNSHARGESGAAVRAERGQRLQRGALQRVARVVVVAQDRAAVREQRGLMALVERAERVVAAAGREAGEPVVAGEPGRQQQHGGEPKLSPQDEAQMKFAKDLTNGLSRCVSAMALDRRLPS